ncbi:hypothetical protein [Mucilaginibacter sp. dw_454]|uniref:hypothetical protein n=1 Tax=Mucilaginibacter sp. dw_454 TaxID=2720079 RepID=UPI001BD31967|nr:hypothetical protein [Mucilaginibacter sp. dw_454]
MTTIALTQPQAAAESRAVNATATRALPIYVYAVVFASFCICIGLIWDISWHMSIGRDGLFAPPHMVTYLGAVTSGLFSGYYVLRLTFAGKTAEKQQSIRFWGIFYGSLGALFCIWGAFTMITSAPFDDWWHNTFGLDVQILSPPHTVLLLGMITIQFGALVSVMALQNREASANTYSPKALATCFMLSSGFLLVMLFTIASEYLTRHDMHESFFYQVASGLFPLFLVAISKASTSKWGATRMAAVYMVMMAGLVWILPLFHAEPKLGPVYYHFTHYQPFHFPLLMIFPALAIDLINHRLINQSAIVKALALGITFTLVLLAVQWPFGDFLASTHAQNWFFGTTSWYFGADPNYEFRYTIAPWATDTGVVLVKGLAIAMLLGTLSSWLGLTWGRWMKSVKR